MNLLNAVVRGGEASLGGLRLKAFDGGLPARRQVTVGLRPEHLTVSAEATGTGLPGSVRRVEDLGADTLIGVQPDPALDLKLWELNQDELIWIRQEGQTRLFAGDPCTVELDTRLASYFDSETGLNLAPADSSASGKLVSFT